MTEQEFLKTETLELACVVQADIKPVPENFEVNEQKSESSLTPKSISNEESLIKDNIPVKKVKKEKDNFDWEKLKNAKIKWEKS